MAAVVAGFAVAASLLLSRRPDAPRRRLDRAVPNLASRGALWRVSQRSLGRWRRHRDRSRREAEVVEVVFALAAELRAGRTPGRALELVSASSALLRVPLAHAAVAVEAGARPGDELERVAALPGCGGLRAAAAAWTVTESAGGAVAVVLDRLGEVLESERQARDALDAALAGPRATMLLLAGLPLLGLFLGQSLGAHPIALLVHRPIGWALLAVGALLDAIGVAWTRLLVRRALR